MKLFKTLLISLRAIHLVSVALLGLTLLFSITLCYLISRITPLVPVVFYRFIHSDKASSRAHSYISEKHKKKTLPITFRL